MEETTIKIMDLEEKRLITACFMSRQKQDFGIENVWRTWCQWWKEDFASPDGKILRMYNHHFVTSKTRARKAVADGEDYKTYPELENVNLGTLEFIKNNYDDEKGRRSNSDRFKGMLWQHRDESEKNLRKEMKRKKLMGWKLQNQTSHKHPLYLGKYTLLHHSKFVVSGSYETILNYIKNMKQEETK